MQNFGRKMCKQQTFNCAEVPYWTMAFLSGRTSNFFFSSEMLFILTFRPSTLCAGLAVQKRFLHLRVSPPTISWDLCACFHMKLGYRTGVPSDGTPVIFTGWGIVFLLVDIFKASPQIYNLKNLTPPPHPPDMPLFHALQPENFIAGYFFVCFGSLEQRPVLTHGVADIHH